MNQHKKLRVVFILISIVLKLKEVLRKRGGYDYS
jgi:hypothetical protein